MMSRPAPWSALLASACLLLLPVRAGAAEGSLEVPSGATVHFFGDSITRGWGFGKYDDPARDEPTRTINDAIRDEGAARKLSVIDMNRAMDRLQDSLMAQGWGSSCHKDGVHPNVFGNLMMAFVMLRAMGADISGWKL